MKIHVRLTPRASSNRIHEDELLDGTQRLSVYVTAVPEDGKANRAMIKLLAEYFKVSPSSIKILQGFTSRNKIVSIHE